MAGSSERNKVPPSVPVDSKVCLDMPWKGEMKTHWGGWGEGCEAVCWLTVAAVKVPQVPGRR